MRRRLIVALSAGAGLTVAGCGSKAAPESADPVEAPGPAPAPAPMPAGLPSWNDVIDQQLQQEPTTNPPSPHLVVGTDGRCFVQWVDVRREDPPPVQVCRPACGAEITCPEQAGGLLETWKQRPLPTFDAVKWTGDQRVRSVHVVDPAGVCYKQWMLVTAPELPTNVDRVQVCDDRSMCGTEVRCDERHDALLAEWTANSP